MRPTLDKHRFGPWAVVTGSSSGIGRAIARHLGSSGINVALIARRQAQLAKMGVDPSETPMKPMSAERCAAEGLTALSRNRATHEAGRVNRLMARLMPRSVATSMMGVMIGKKLARKALATSAAAPTLPVHPQ